MIIKFLVAYKCGGFLSSHSIGLLADIDIQIQSK